MKFLPLVVCLFGLGCARQDPFVGTWAGNTTLIGQPAKVTWTFRADGTLTDTMQAVGPDGKGLITRITGTWKRTADDNLELGFSDIEIEPIGLAAARQEALSAQFARVKQDLLTQANAEPILQISWSGEDSFTSTTKRGSLTLVREKG